MISAKIHPQLLVYPGAQIGDGVEIGRFDIRTKAVIGEKNDRESHVVIEGEVAIGSGISLDTAPSCAPPQDLAFSPERRLRLRSATRTSFANTAQSIAGALRGASPKSRQKLSDGRRAYRP